MYHFVFAEAMVVYIFGESRFYYILFFPWEISCKKCHENYINTLCSAGLKGRVWSHADDTTVKMGDLLVFMHFYFSLVN